MESTFIILHHMAEVKVLPISVDWHNSSFTSRSTSTCFYFGNPDCWFVVHVCRAQFDLHINVRFCEIESRPICNHTKSEYLKGEKGLITFCSLLYQWFISLAKVSPPKAPWLQIEFFANIMANCMFTKKPPIFVQTCYTDWM